ncbi:hypothetical protein N1851_023075 [Merluccius polli]|uniref:Uncharacterized protein n=1 Tax=Merluccius polli TaxID=89951 RepID=A0AA47MGQ4_MERPO|nr:hypothetical protein N1851_023075 [Merluccius polli]
MRQLLSISMDGPNVNLKFLELLQKEQAEQYGGAYVIVVGSCGLHTDFTMLVKVAMWQLEEVFRTLHFLFHNVPDRKEDLTAVIVNHLSPSLLWGSQYRWIENLPVAEWAVEVLPSLIVYLGTVCTKKLPIPGMVSFDTLEAAHHDPLTMA